ncbi:hypothetical protein [Scytonema sp. NUACC26]|uniref:hypothetical protein n=1 Tax=Scytonema sp. NUACC26 TaxID=3140176 RepID=UPI0034DCB8E1
MHLQPSGQKPIQQNNLPYPQININSNYPRPSAFICGSKNKISKLGLLLISSCSLTSAIIGFETSKVIAQLTIQSTGTLSGTIQLPSFNPNFNNRVTRIDTDTNGTYMRNIGTKQNPNYVPIYTSQFVKVQTRADGSLGYYVDFKGIPVISLDGILSSPALSGGQLEAYIYQGKIPGTKFQGVVQDEFGLTKAFYTGVVTDPKTGQQYQGKFEVNGQGPRYSDRNGGQSPTVFDFRSDIPGKPSVTSLKMTNSPLVRLTIKVPADATPIVSNPTPPSPQPPTNPTPTPPPPPPVISNPTLPPTTPPPVSNPAPTPNTPSVSNPAQTPNTPSVSNPAQTPNTPSVSNPAQTPSTPSVSNPAQTPNTPSVSNPAQTPSTPIVDNNNEIPSSIPTIDVNETNSPSPSTLPQVEFSNGNFLNTNQTDPSALASGICSRNNIKNSTQCDKKISTPKQTIGPRSRVMLR